QRPDRGRGRQRSRVSVDRPWRHGGPGDPRRAHQLCQRDQRSRLHRGGQPDRRDRRPRAPRHARIPPHTGRRHAGPGHARGRAQRRRRPHRRGGWDLLDYRAQPRCLGPDAGCLVGGATGLTHRLDGVAESASFKQPRPLPGTKAMTWTQVYDPLHNWILSTLVTALPILVLFGLLAGLRVKPHWCAIAGAGTAVLVAVLVFGMPLRLAGMSFVYGVGFGIVKIAWIVLAAVYLRSEEHTSELQSRFDLVCRLLLE